MTPTVWPQFDQVIHDDTYRLIPGEYAEVPEKALAGLVDSDDELDQLIRIAAATNSRLLAQEERPSAGLSRTDLVFGVPYSRIINGAFSYAGEGARFHTPGPKGAWYCALSVDTCVHEVAFHRIRHLRETGAPDEDDIAYRLFLADIHAQDFAMLGDGHPSSLACLDPNSYTASQVLGAQLRSEGRGGVEYPSVRHPGGTCLAVLQAPIVSNVRLGDIYLLTVQNFMLTKVAIA
jgi:RES domain-containing protein